MTATKQPIKLMYFITDLRFGGAQTVLLYLMEYLDRSRFSPQVVCLYGGDSPLAQKIRAMGVSVTDLKMSHSWRVDALWRFYLLLRREKIIILHASLFHANLVARIVGRIANIPIIISWRQNISLGGWTREFVNRLTARLDDRVVAVSEPARQAELENTKVPEEKIELIYNCIDCDQYSQSNIETRQRIRDELDLPQDAIVIGFVGRLHRQKAVDRLLEAFSNIDSGGVDVRLLIVGDGVLKSELQSLAKNFKIQDRIVFSGIRQDIPDIFASIDIFTLPSRWEGLPLALLEAMASQLPVVVTPVGGVSNVVIDGESGLLVPVEDVDALSNALITLIGDPKLRNRMGTSGRERVRELFSAQKISQELATLYDELMASSVSHS